MLSKSRTVLKHHDDTEDTPECVLFQDPDKDAPEEDQGRAHLFYLDRSVWEDMDQPEIVTVTIEQGDKLNDGGVDG